MQDEFEQRPQVEKTEMDSAKLYEALFTLADHWCPSLDPAEYKEFFDQIKYRMKYSGMQNPNAYDAI